MCNGWTNRETWLVNLWFGDWFTADADDGVAITPVLIKETVETYIDGMLKGDWSNFIVDMMDLGAINYAELAAHYVTEDA